MSDYVISCCSTIDIPRDYVESRDIKYVCFNYELGDKHYKDDMGITMSMDEFYNKMSEGLMTRTSQVNVEEYVEHFEKFLKEGKDVLHMTLSSGISGTYNSATIARDELLEKYPDRKLIVIDSLAASAGFGLLVDKACDLRDAGKTIDENAAWIEEHKLEDNHWFFSTDLTYFIRGGRISKTSGVIGGLLNICPFMNVDFEGKLIVREKIRTKKKVIKVAADKMKELAKDGVDYDEKVFISCSQCYEDAKALAALIEEAFPKMNGKVMISDIGTTIGSHTGPGTVALFFWGKKRVD